MTSPELDWLSPPPESWSDTLRSVEALDAKAAWGALTGLANARLSALQTVRLDRRVRGRFAAAPAGLATKPVRLAVLGTSTVDHLLAGIRVGALRRGIWADTHVPDYGMYASELSDPASELHAFRPDTVLFAQDAHHMLAGIDACRTPAEADARLETILATTARHWDAAREAFRCRVIQQAMLPVFPRLFGSQEHRLPASRAAAVERFNARLRGLADEHGVDVLALDARAAQDGIGAWHDPMLWHRAKQEVHPGAAPVYGDLVARLLAAAQGRSFKALVLDLDNTLWGGVIGDDGMDGIVLGQGSSLGEAFVAFQLFARALSARGIILAVCSKNDEANALEPFDSHPDMVLRRGDIACFVANWTDKAANIREIAERLSIGLDSLVFVDDNPFERAIVRRELPMVAVPEVPEDPALFAQCLADAGYFESLVLTDEDLERSGQYQANLARETLKASTTDMDSYLRSLDMEMRWSRFDRLGLQRIVQLINKTNQFNLTTRRTSEAEVLAMIADNRALSAQIRLVDTFGDNGIIGIVAGHFDGDSTDMHIDTWLMSCRVLGRQVEEATLNLVAAQARQLGAGRLIGEYRPTAKNGMVREHYRKLGFAPLEAHGDGRTTWALDLHTFEPAPTFIRTVEV